MWIKTQETDTHRAMLVNMNRIDTVSVDNVYKKFQLVAFGQLTSNEDFANIATLFEGTQEDCEALLSWIFARIDWAETFDVNDWIESHKPVNPDEFPEIVGDVVEKDDVPF